MKNDDDNKTFSIGFKTIPKDNTGICHIIEHCVLSGSWKRFSSQTSNARGNSACHDAGSVHCEQKTFP